MILVVCTGFAVGSALLSRERIRRFARIELRHLELVWIALSAQLLLFEFFAGSLPEGVANGIHLATYVLALLFIFVNRHLPGAPLIGLGAASNFTAIVANGGTMPASPSAWERAGLPEIPPDVFENSSALSSPRLGFLGDIWAVPAQLPLSNVFSVGDVLIVVGGGWLAHRWCASPFPIGARDDERADGETRTLTDGDLNPAPLPIGLRRPGRQGTPRRWLGRVADRSGGRAPDRRGTDQTIRRLGVAVSQQLWTTATVTLLAVAALALVWCLVLIEVSAPPTSTNWPMFAVCAVGLVICERSEQAWIRFGPIGMVTPLWLFAFAMLLVGSASLTVGVATVGATLHALKILSSPLDTVARVSSTALALASAGLILHLFDATGTSNDLEVVTWEWGSAIGAAGTFMIVVNAFTAAVWLSARRRTSLTSLLRHGLGSRVTAEGALISLAPIWVIAVAISPVILPLLAITTTLVFRSTRQALEQSHESLHDQLTGLLNRRAFLDHIEDLLNARVRRGRSFILLMDLDGFKDINDRLGHQMGDALLIAFADRLELGRPADAQAARLGGDEFALLVRSTPLDEVTLVESLHHQLTQPLTLEGFPITIGVSIGIAEATVDAKSTTDLIRAADVAMYRAKRTGLPYATYASSSKSPQHGRLNLLSDLGSALDRNQLHINFQPQLRMSDGSVDTLEALVRWNHPTYGMIPPSEFIGMAEQTDLIEPITELVLRAATQGLMVGGLTERLAVNVSARSLERPDFATRVFEILAESGFPPGQLELEVTERALVRNAERTSYSLGRLRDAGVRVAIDDFGVGYSSYQTLRVLDVDRVKIDRDFVTGVLASDRDRIIVASLIRLSHDLGLDVVAEGVESTHIWDALVELECDVAQGYGIAVPMTYPEMRRWVKGWTHAVGEPTPPDSDEFVTLRR